MFQNSKEIIKKRKEILFMLNVQFQMEGSECENKVRPVLILYSKENLTKVECVKCLENIIEVELKVR